MVFSLDMKAQRGGGGGSGNSCNSISVTAVATESRCRATGTITITATGGTGNFNYRVTGTVSTNFTSSNVITGLPPGTYTVEAYDLTLNCSRTVTNMTITGSYLDPRFSLNATHETCKNARNGELNVSNLSGGRFPYNFRIVAAPSPSLIGQTSPFGIFSNLPPGDYTIQMEDSCSGLQTRRATILPYDWSVRSTSGIRFGCDSANLTITVQDNRGRRTGQLGDSVFNTFRYGWVRGANDTAWFTTNNFRTRIGTRRSLTLVVRDGCGNVASAPWAVNPRPTIGATVQTTQTACNEFTAAVVGAANLTNPSFCLFNSNNVQVGSCNTNGQFSGFPAGFYTIRVRDNCYDTTIVVPFSVAQPRPTLNGPIDIVRATCTTFNAQVNGLVNFTNPQFCLRQGATTISCNTTGIFSGISNGTYTLEVRDGCYDTTIVRNVEVLPLVPSVSNIVAVTNHQCTTFDAAIQGQANLSDPVYTLVQGSTTIATNTTGVFTSLPYGDYCIRVRNNPACYDTTITVCFTGARIPPSVGESLTLVRLCNTINLSVNGQNQIYNPQYCIYDGNNQLIQCNTTGAFTGLPYGAYCLTVRNDPTCYDTTITRCVLIEKLRPELGPVDIQQNCTDFNASSTGEQNIYNPVYTLKDALGNIIATNTTGAFTNLPYGSYCMEMRNDPLCYDTTIIRCFTGTRPIPTGGVVTASNLTCPGFTATVSGLQNFNNPTFTLKNSGGTVIETNSTGVFNITGYGNFCIDIRNDPNCYDTTITRCVDPQRPVPSVDTVRTSNLTCSGFTAELTGQTLLTNPVFNVLNASNALVASNTTGTFVNLPYGSYTMQVIDGCYPTPFLVPFGVVRPPMSVQDSVAADCAIGNTSIFVNISSGFQPFVVTVFDPLNVPVANVVSANSSVTVNNLPSLAAGLEYRVVVVDSCGQSVTRMVSPVLSSISRTISVVPQCPTGLLPNGSSDVVVVVSSNLGDVEPVIIRRDNDPEFISYTIRTGNEFRFNELGPATYVIQYDLPGGCSNKIYDTVVVTPYVYPNLVNSAVYQCSNNSFSVSTQMSGGTGPYEYQIIGSVPNAPSITTGWQSSPVFDINNGQAYTLVRLRSIDACGNASLADAPVLPLQNVLVQASSQCLNTDVTLSATAVANAEYTWFKRDGQDSVQVGTGPTYFIPALSPADTGRYVVRVSVNNGCLVTYSNFTILGNCILLPVTKLELSGVRNGSTADLKWDAAGENNVREYVVERSNVSGGGFSEIGRIPAKPAASANTYRFNDPKPAAGVNFYRVRAVDRDGKFTLSNTISLSWTSLTNLRIYPVPARDLVNLVFSGSQSRDYTVQLYSLNGQVLQEKKLQRMQQGTLQIQRRNLAAGMYLVRITDLTTGAVQTEKIIFE